jgi:hypothetical protein
MIELEFRNVDLRMEENQRPWRKTLEARERINNKLNSHVMPSPRIEPKIAVVRGEQLAAMPPMVPIRIKKTLSENILVSALIQDVY